MHNIQAATAMVVVLLGTSGALAQENSGFLADAYGKLQETTSASNAQVKRWVAPSLVKYDKVLLEKTVLYPEPRSTNQVSSATLQSIKVYLDESLRREIGAVAQLVDTPGPGTVRLKPAITAAAAKDQGFKPYEILPAAFVFSQIKKASGTRAKEAALAVEWEARDAQTGELVAAGMREGRGEKLKAPTDSVTLDNYKPVLDVWAKDARAAFETGRNTQR
jgi:hypothetical protein